jgi:lipopolysaccharide/colanic/teichoic acid biosynthesis glycosyltransferase
MNANGDDFLATFPHPHKTNPVPQKPRMTRLGIFMRKTSLDELL